MVAALFVVPSVAMPQSASAQLGECFECVDSDVTGCKMCRHHTTTGEDDCTTPECDTCGDAGGCEPEVTMAAAALAESVVKTIHNALVAPTTQENGNTAALATAVGASEAPAGMTAFVRRELREHDLYLTADGSIRTCDGALVGHLSIFPRVYEETHGRSEVPRTVEQRRALLQVGVGSGGVGQQ